VLGKHKGNRKKVLAKNDNKCMFLELPKSGFVPDGDLHTRQIRIPTHHGYEI